MRPTTLVRLGLAGTRTDAMRVVLTALSTALATLAVLAAANVVAIGQFGDGSGAAGGSEDWSQQYSNALLREPGLRPGVAITLLLLTLPVFALAGQCARLGAPARDRRLAAFRLAGATPWQTTAVAVAETGLAGLIGSLTGTAAFLAGHRLLDRPGPDGLLPLPTDVWPAPWFVVVAPLAIPVAGALAAALVMRRVTVSPFGLVRRVRRTEGPQPWSGVFIVIGVLAFAAIGTASQWGQHVHVKVPAWTLPAGLLLGSACAGFGVVLGTGWLAYTGGRLLHRFSRRPAGLLAAGRLMTDPWSGSRTLAVLLVCVLFGAGAAGMRAQFAAQAAIQRDAYKDYFPSEGLDPFYMRTMDLIDAALMTGLVLTALAMLVVVAEGIVTRRRAYASLVATGVPRGTLSRSILWQSLLPAVPAILVALIVGVSLVRTLGAEVQSGGGSASQCIATAAECESSDPQVRAQATTIVEIPTMTRAVPVPWAELARDGGIAVLAVLGTTGLGLLFLRRSTDLEELRAT
ncbi:ABC transporter permease [Dactylosporangium sp. NBC_01737]|uniref:ABC transporter permease n=1 Tax=Dactylosporangium sp. NBC_01737 TaxID=2975959 RepID=UPI002E0ED69F|nr:ABC transporter permease [Dactylosporangium sp. NBC_01737]